MRIGHYQPFSFIPELNTAGLPALVT